MEGDKETTSGEAHVEMAWETNDVSGEKRLTALVLGVDDDFVALMALKGAIEEILERDKSRHEGKSVSISEISAVEKELRPGRWRG